MTIKKYWLQLVALLITVYSVVLFFISTALSNKIGKLVLNFLRVLDFLMLLTAILLVYIISKSGLDAEEEAKINTTDLTHVDDDSIVHDPASDELSTKAIEEIINGTQSKSVKREKIISLVCNTVNACQAAFFTAQQDGDKRKLVFSSGFAFYVPENKPYEFYFGEGITGQVAMNKSTLVLDDIPADYHSAVSGLGKSIPKCLLVVPVMKDSNVTGIIEISLFNKASGKEIAFVEKVSALLISVN